MESATPTASATPSADATTTSARPVVAAGPSASASPPVVAPPPFDPATLTPVPLADLQGIDARISADVFDALSVDASIAARKSFGGTAPEQVRARIAAARDALGMAQ